MDDLQRKSSEICEPGIGQRLVERLPVYPEHLLQRPDFFDPQVREAALRLADGAGWARSGAQAEAA